MLIVNSAVHQALLRGGIADITTIGRKTGLPRRIEIYFHHFDGEFFLTGRPGRKRDWVANIEASPAFTLHLKRGVEADIPVLGSPEPDPDVRGKILFRVLVENWDSDPERAKASLGKWVEGAPFIRFHPVEEPGS